MGFDCRHLLVRGALTRCSRFQSGERQQVVRDQPAKIMWPKRETRDRKQCAYPSCGARKSQCRGHERRPPENKRPNNSTDFVSKKMSIRQYLVSFQGRYDAYLNTPRTRRSNMYGPQACQEPRVLSLRITNYFRLLLRKNSSPPELRFRLSAYLIV